MTQNPLIYVHMYLYMDVYIYLGYFPLNRLTKGNVIALIGTTILVGFQRQISAFSDPKRKIISIVFFGSIACCLVFPFLFSGKTGQVLTFVAMLTQIISYWVYALSYIPCVKNMCKSCFDCFKN